jgi:hypothetical protein
MTSAARKRIAINRSGESVGVLRWVFIRGTKTLTCEVRVNGRHSHDVCVVPHWDVSSSIVERHERAASALWRNAEIASHFRQAGWIVVRDSESARAGAAI